MTCPYCGKRTPDGSEYCTECGYPIDAAARKRAAEQSAASPLGNRKFDPIIWYRRAARALRVVIKMLFWLISICVFAYAGYKVYYWSQSNAVLELYEDGILRTPTIESVTLRDGRQGHVITFYGDDGDMIYIEELQRSYLVVGGEAHIEIPDSYWFEKAAESVEMAEIAFTPIQTLNNGGKRLLPVLYFNVDVPSSPLEILSPSEKRENTLSSEYQLKFVVVPGSTVLVDGMDVTNLVNAQGEVTVSVAVYPQGDNPISILVKTAHHRETRADIVLYREPMEIDLSLAINTARSSLLDAMSIRGTVDPGAEIVVETPYKADTLKVEADGSFSFIATFDHIGDNGVLIRAKKPGKQDSVLYFTVYYLPTLNEYSRRAWVMDYDQLIRCWDIWAGRVFKCTGTVAAVLSYEPQVVVLDVSKDGSGDYLVVENMSGTSITEPGGRYEFYADVSGERREYIGDPYPYMYGRYASPVN